MSKNGKELSNETETSNFLQKLTNNYKKSRITKDFSLQDYHAKNANNEVLEIDIISIQTHYMEKYDRSDEGKSLGFHTSFTLPDGTIIGTWSNGIYLFACYFLKMAGLNTSDFYNEVRFDSPIKIGIKPLPLSKSEWTYDVEIISGQVTKLITDESLLTSDYVIREQLE